MARAKPAQRTPDPQDISTDERPRAYRGGDDAATVPPPTRLPSASVTPGRTR
jgi:hypothetical protein